MNPLPAVGTNWAAEFTALYYNNRAMKTASKGMSIDEFIDEIHLYALMHRTERTSMFHKELWFGIRGQEHKWDTVEDKLLHLMGVEEMLNANKQSSIQHSKPTNRPPVSYHPAPLPPSTSISHPFPPPYDTSFLRDDGQANVSRAVSRGFYSESHYMSECNSFEMPDCNDSINNFQTFARSGNNYNRGGGLRSGSRGRGGRSKV
ncbi:hypothetical protein FRC19_008072 [Serendipita sp. 401]|nr:hypothetical protein FRC19_008072 [Serendipita sp. 401]